MDARDLEDSISTPMIDHDSAGEAIGDMPPESVYDDLADELDTMEYTRATLDGDWDDTRPPEFTEDTGVNDAHQADPFRDSLFPEQTPGYDPAPAGMFEAHATLVAARAMEDWGYPPEYVYDDRGSVAIVERAADYGVGDPDSAHEPAYDDIVDATYGDGVSYTEFEAAHADSHDIGSADATHWLPDDDSYDFERGSRGIGRW